MPKTRGPAELGALRRARRQDADEQVKDAEDDDAMPTPVKPRMMPKMPMMMPTRRDR